MVAPHSNLLPLPPHFDSASVSKLWKVPYQARATEANAWAKKHSILPAARDKKRVCLMLIDVQNTFCLPDFELFVGGRSGTGAVDDNQRLCKFIYQNMQRISEIDPTMDTHTAMQIFHPMFWINDAGDNPPPFTMISYDDVKAGRWKVNPAIARSIAGGNYIALQQHALH